MNEEEALVQDFITEAEEHLEDIELNAVALEKTGADAETVNSLFRSFHTIKGNSSWLGFQPIVKVTHAIESLLGDLRSEKLTLNFQMIDLILEVKDIVSKQIDLLKVNDDIGRYEIDSVIERISDERKV